MWAGGRLRLHRPLLVGEAVEKVSTVRSVTRKQGRSGPLAFVLVEHRLETPDGGVAIVEEQDLVYREPSSLPSASPRAAAGGRWRRSWRPDTVLLFRYSALTYNGHRIHYDVDHARREEGYPGLVVHGPLLATLMLDLVRRERPDAAVTGFALRAVTPLFAGEPLTVHGEPPAAGEGGPVRLWVAGPDGRLAMEGEAGWRRAGLASRGGAPHYGRRRVPNRLGLPMPTATVAAVIFDLGGVLNRLGPAPPLPQAVRVGRRGRDGAVPGRGLHRRLEPRARRRSAVRRGRGRAQPATSGTARAHRGLPPALDRDDRGPIRGTVDLLEALAARDVPLYAITNWSAETFLLVRRIRPTPSSTASARSSSPASSAW
jgi:3-methylfumaryl-CoA hydratase